MSPHPLLIGGCPRSGTTALIQILNSNPKVFISSEENLIKLKQTLSKSLGTKERRASTISQGMRVLSSRETLSVDNIHQHNFSESSVWPSIRHIYKWHHRQMHGEENLEIWGDKLPNYYKDLPEILSLKGVKYLHITRHPLDVINSMLRRTEMARQGLDWWKAVTEFKEMLNTWTAAYKSICALEGNKVLHIHYEDLVFNFPQTISSINNFIGIDLEYKNILIQERDKHFDRSFINDQQTSEALNNSTVKDYLSSRPETY